MHNDKIIILFDGVCNLCNSSVNFIIDKDKKDVFRFAPLQSDYGRNVSEKFGLPTGNYDSFVLIENGKCYIKSSAALKTARHLPHFYKLFYAFIIIPPFLRNPIYDFIASNRYKWFGKKDSCRIPTPELKNKFLE